MIDLESQAMAAADDILATYRALIDTDKLPLFLALAWTQGYGSGLSAGKEIADEAFGRFVRAIES